MQLFSPEDGEEEVAPISHHHVADQWHSQRHQSHAHGHVHHNGDIESPLVREDSDADSDSTSDDAEPKIGRRRQIIGILVRHAPFTWWMIQESLTLDPDDHRFCN
jgi:hypothetical protein